MSKTKIEWCDVTINPLIGCSKISPACDNCYAINMARRLQSMGTRGYNGVVESGNWTGKINFVRSELDKPKKWKKSKKIFIGSMTDIFHENVMYDALLDIFTMIALNPQHTFIILTKRPKKMRAFIDSEWYTGIPEYVRDLNKITNQNHEVPGLPLKNLWIGVTVENQEQCDNRLPILEDVSAAVKFISVEPMLSKIKLSESQRKILDWVIVGGESGTGARPMSGEWVDSLYYQCDREDLGLENIPFFFKQWGEWTSGVKAPVDYIKGEKTYKKGFYHDFGGAWMALKVGKKSAGVLLWDELIQEFPRNLI